ncbi:hypothetical protein [Nocardioides stalactiti]|uniref:hypothetical protein n=1 Tax=Nocardioides stalactiti TaxID=2755356 RepID=UPI0015FFB51E|nr:hypothetical protein [Nocardioides stalactiti]
MSPWDARQRRSWPVTAGMGLVLLGFVAGFQLLSGVIGDDHDAEAPGPTVTVLPTPTVPADPDQPDEEYSMLEVVGWGRASGQLAVVVRNNTDTHINSARVRITGVDVNGTMVVTTTGTPRDVCCTIVGLPPGKEYGLFAPVGDDVGEIAEVDVQAISTRVRRGPTRARVSASDLALKRFDDDTVVTARLTARGPRLSGFVAVQAILVDQSGEVAQVISGRYYCFGDRTTAAIRLRLFHAVPDRLRVRRVLAYPVPVGVLPRVPGECARTRAVS